MTGGRSVSTCAYDCTAGRASAHAASSAAAFRFQLIMPFSLPQSSMVVARQPFGLCDALLLSRSFEDRSAVHLADKGALDFLPRRLGSRVGTASCLAQRRAASFDLAGLDLQSHFPPIQVD